MPKQTESTTGQGEAKALRELPALEALFREFSDNSPNMMFINQFGRISYANKRCSELMGYSREELEAPGFDFMCLIAPESREAVKAAYARHGAGQSVERYEIAAVAKDGRRIETILATWLGQANGKPAIFGLQTDITERRQMERELRASEERYRTLVGAIPDGIIVSDMQGAIEMANDAAALLFGYENAAALGKDGPRNVFDVIVPAEREGARELGRQAIGSGRAERGEFGFVRRDGEMVPVELTLAVLHDPKGAPVSMVGVGRDLTEHRAATLARARLETQMHHAQRLESLGVLAGGIAHDFNNLLVGVLGNASLALMDLPPEAPSRVALEQIALAARRAASLTHQMLAYSGRGTFAREPLQLGEVVAEMVQLLEAAIPKGVKVEYDFVEGTPRIEGDAAQMQQVVMNLITNAAEAMGGRNGGIRVRVDVADGQTIVLDEFVAGEPLSAGPYVCLTVVDEGVGMEPATRDRMFEPFFTTKFAGRGLGLAAVLGIVRGHHGTLTVRTGLGRGSQFRVLIPAHADGGDVAASPVARVERIELGSGQATILVADDEEVVRTLAARALERAGFVTVVARDGLEAVAMVREHGDQLAAVILDLTMPNLSGADACRQMQELRPGLPVVLSSGYSAAEATERFSSLRLAGFMQKPYLPQDLVRAVQDAVRAARPGSPRPV